MLETASKPDVQWEWNNIDWRKTTKTVRELRQQIFRASQRENLKLLSSLQTLMLKSRANAALSVWQVTQTNRGQGEVCSLLEPCAVKVARTVLRGPADGNISRLPASLMEESASSGFRSFLMVIAAVFTVAQVYAEAAEDRQAGVTLTAGEIDSSTVEAGAFAVVIHGLGERHPVSGAWEQLRTDRGYIVAIDAKTLTLGLRRDEWPEVIALERIQTLVLAGTARLTDGGVSGALPKSAVTDSGQVDSGAVAGLTEKEKEFKVLPLFGKLAWRASKNPGSRIFLKIGYGTLTSVVSSLVVVEVYQRHGPEDPPPQYVFGALAYGFFFGWPIGVYGADPWESSFWMTTVGHGVGLWTVQKGMTDLWGLACFAIVASELSRLAPKEMRNPNPLQWLFGKVRRPDARVSFGLAPEPRRGLSAKATLRF